MSTTWNDYDHARTELGLNGHPVPHLNGPGAFFRALDPRSGNELGLKIRRSGPEDVENTVTASAVAFTTANQNPGWPASALRAIADSLDAHATTLVALATAETGLDRTRLTGEVARTSGQLRLFADIAEQGTHRGVTIDHQDPDAKPIRRPDLRRTQIPLGPVAVFGASNFPFAFGALGGDTASALAAGCTVVVKLHPAHPATGEAVVALAREALARTGHSADALTTVHDDGIEAAQALVRDDRIEAVAFTGSRTGGRALYDLAASRPRPVPVFAEMGSPNPVVLLPGAVEEAAPRLAEEFVNSLLNSNGQLCTKPGLLLHPAGAAGERFAEIAAALVREAATGTALSRPVADGFTARRDTVGRFAGVHPLARAAEETHPGLALTPELVRTDAASAAQNPELLHEVFGPFAVLIGYQDPEQLRAVLRALPGSLTATLHASETPQERQRAHDLLPTLAERAGRLIWNGWPTGVAVAHAMHHGGPYPATTAPSHTSVGGHAITRFLRPILFQDFPEQLLPAELREQNATQAALVDGHWTTTKEAGHHG